MPRNLNFFFFKKKCVGGRGRGEGHFDWRWRALILEKIWLTIGGRSEAEKGEEEQRGVGTGSLKKRLLSSGESRGCASIA